MMLLQYLFKLAGTDDPERLEQSAADRPVVRTLFPIICDELMRSGASEIPPFLKEAQETQLLLSDKMDASRTHVEKALQSHSVPFRHYKGPDLGARCWPDPRLRPSRDIDLLVDPENLSRAEEALEESGYVWTWRANYHTQFRRQGIAFEIHNAPFSYKYHVLFEWPCLSTRTMIAEGIDDSLYLILLCIEIFDELGRDRLIPFADLFLLQKKGVDLDRLTRWLEQANTAFPLLFCHYRHLTLTGLPLFPDTLLNRVRSAYRRNSTTGPLPMEKELSRLAGTAQDKKQLWTTVFRMTRNKPGVLLGLIFPPKNVSGPSLWSYWMRTLRRA